MKQVSLIIILLFAAPVMPSLAATCNGITDSLGIKKVSSVLVFSSPHLNVDADGAPNSYRLDGNGLSYTCDGVVAIENGQRVTPKSDKANWQAKCNAAWKKARETNDYSGVAIFGFATDRAKRPLVQRAGDPLPGEAFISTTSVQIPEAPEGTQRRQIDATKIPYVVLPAAVIKKYSVPPAAIAIVYRPSTDKLAFAVYGDGGDLGEGSVKLHFDLGSDPIVVKGGVKRAKSRIEDRVVTFVFPSTKTNRVLDHEAWNAEIQSVGKAALEQFGGIEKIKLCAQ
jgi:hypothetical protein